MKTRHTPDKGFTLIELMMVVAVIAILAAIAYPSYIDSVRKSRRSLAKSALMEAAQKQEAYYARNATYTTDLVNGLNYSNSPHKIKSDSGTEYFDMVINKPNGNCPITSCYRLTARAKGDQLKDKFTRYRLWSTGRKEKYNGSWSDGWPE